MTSILIDSIPELLMCKLCPPYEMINAPAWYFSAMLICMVPLAYLLYTKKDFAVYVFAPVTAVLLFSYMCKINDYSFGDLGELYGLVLGMIVFAVCGLNFGICAWAIYDKINNINAERNQRIAFTAAEVILWCVYLYTMVFTDDRHGKMSVQFVLPIAVAITFSEKSYIGKFFQFAWMKRFSGISLSILLNHCLAQIITQDLFSGRGYTFCVLVMAALTLVLCCLNHLIVSLVKLVWRKCFKKILSNANDQLGV